MIEKQDTSELLKAAREYFKEGHYKIVEPMIEQMLRVDNSNPEVYYMSGVLCFEKGQLTKAMNFFRKSLELDPCFIDASIGLSIILNDLGYYKEGRQVFEKAYSFLKDRESSTNQKLAQKHEELADLYFLHKRYNEALDHYNKSAHFSKNQDHLKDKMKIIQTRLHQPGTRASVCPN